MYPTWGPTSALPMVLAVLGSLLVTTVTVLRWDTGRMRTGRRVAGLLLSFGLLSVATLILVNRQVNLFVTWADVWGAW